jgi:hypothetical protein
MTFNLSLYGLGANDPQQRGRLATSSLIVWFTQLT